MKTRRNNKRPRKHGRKTRSKKQKGSGANCSRPGQCTTDQNMEEEDPNTIDEYLEGAVEEELPEYVKEYLVKGANPNVMITDEHEYLQEHELVPAIIYAARHIQPSTILKHLVEHGASVERDEIYTGSTPLIEAAEWGNLSAVKFLLNKGANINATTVSGITAIGYAVLNGDIPMIKLMLKERKGEIDFNYTINFGFDKDNENVIDDADENAENPEVAKILKEYAIEQKLPIHSERQNNRLEVGRVMDKKRMPGDLTHKIITEHFGGKRKTRKYKKTKRQQKGGKKGKNTRKNNKKSRKSKRKTRSKRQSGGDVEEYYELIIASRDGDIEIVEMLLENGADVNAKTDTGTTALFNAILNRRTEVVRILLENGADVHVKTMYGSTTLDMASWYGDIEIVSMLLEKGADVNAKGKYGSTALIKASENGHTEVVRMLLEKGADVNVKDDNGSTALMKASKEGRTEIVELLEKVIKTEKETRSKKQKAMELVTNRVGKVPSLQTLAHRNIDTHATNLYNKAVMDGAVPPLSSKLGGKRKTRKSKKSNKRFRTSRKKK